MSGYAMIASWVAYALRNQSKCAEYPEQCEAIAKYDKAKHKFSQNQIKDGLKQYKKEVTLFKDRMNKKEWKNIYPINNHDYNYENVIRNNYNPFVLGITNKPTVGNLIDGSKNLTDLMDVMLEKPLPDNGHVSGKTDLINSPGIKNKIKQIKDNYRKVPLPYPSFKTDYPESKYPTTGKHAASYFIKTGTCSTKINNESICKNRGYNWVKNKMNLGKESKFFTKVDRKKTQQAKKRVTGSCFKPRFSYINNHAKGFQNFKGLSPAFYNDVMSLTPEKLGAIMAGNTVDGSGMVPCPEGFHNYQHHIKNKSYSILFLLSTIVIIIMFLFLLSRFVYN
uniref:Uncharacterized protein n=1 Tax=viral metagenome TaxID=1070528 RepID=A0A6C0LYP1_9ZZZZ